MRLLAIDTCLDACSVAVVAQGLPLATLSEPMARGHQERLAPMAGEAMAAAGLAFADLDRIAVTVGPGSFTGLRVGLAFAKGLALALDRPCTGVGVLEALARTAELDEGAAVIDAGRGFLWLQIFRDGEGRFGPACLSAGAAAAAVGERLGLSPRLVGPGAAVMSESWPGAVVLPLAFAHPAAVAALAEARPDVAADPVYLRPPDARVRA